MQASKPARAQSQFVGAAHPKIHADSVTSARAINPLLANQPLPHHAKNGAVNPAYAAPSLQR